MRVNERNDPTSESPEEHASRACEHRLRWFVARLSEPLQTERHQTLANELEDELNDQPQHDLDRDSHD
jgi:hypothetical protein